MLMSKKGLLDTHSAGQDPNKDASRRFVRPQRGLDHWGLRLPCRTLCISCRTGILILYGSSKPAESNIISLPELDVPLLVTVTLSVCCNTRSSNAFRTPLRVTRVQGLAWLLQIYLGSFSSVEEKDPCR